jgi:putative aldouronate transport system substrate-binding protein
VKSFADIEPMLETIRANEPSVVPLGVSTEASPLMLLNWDKFSSDLLPGAIAPDGDGRTVVNDFAAPSTKAMLETLHRFYLAGYIRKDAAAVEDGFESDVADGKFFCYASELDPELIVEASRNGTPWVGIQLTAPMLSTSNARSAMSAIPKTTRNPARAMMFLELLNSDPTLKNLLTYGVEGVDYTVVSPGVVQPVETSGYRGMIAMGWAIGNQMINWLTPLDSPDRWTSLADFNARAVARASLGFRFNGSNVSEETKACADVTGEFWPMLATGTADPAVTLPKMLDELDRSGAQAVLAEMQSQFDTFRLR